MAAKITATGPVNRRDLFLLNPEDIKKGHNSRMVPTPDYESKVVNKALSIFHEGQLEPGRGHKNEEDEVILDTGFTRLDAVALLRRGFEAIDPVDGETRFFHDKDIQYSIILDRETKDVEKALVKGIIENSQRDDTTDVQEALAQQELRDVYRWEDARIARTYGYNNSNRVMFLKQLLTLPQAIVDRVHSGDLALHAALELKKLPEETREAVEQKVAQGDLTSASEIREEIREVVNLELRDEGGSEAQTPAKKIGRTIRDFRNFNQELQDETCRAAGNVKKLFAYLEEWFSGSRQDKSLWTVIAELKDVK